MQDPNGIIFRAIPDSGVVRAKFGIGRGPSPVFPNTVVLTEPQIAALESRGRDYWWDKTRPELEISGRNWVFNTLADPFEYDAALGALERALHRTQIPAFNHPQGIRRTARQLTQEVYSDIPGLIVPKCTVFTPERPSDVIDHFEEQGYEYPVILRPVSSQTGRGMHNIESYDDWPAMPNELGGAQQYFMTQVVDFSAPDGKFHKVRVICIGNRIQPWHHQIGSHWEVRGTSVRHDPTANRRLHEDDKKDWPGLVQVAEKVRDSVELDYFGMDIGVISPDRFVLFEVTAAMTFVGMGSLHPDNQASAKRIQDRFMSRVERTLAAFASDPVAYQAGLRTTNSVGPNR